MGLLRQRVRAGVCLLAAAMAACGGNSKSGPDALGAGAGSPSAGGGPSAGAMASIGGGTAVMGGSESAGTSVGGTAPADAGRASSGGAETLGGSSSAGASAGAAGTSNSGAPVPSPACALAKRPAKDSGFARYTLPEKYDAVTPLPIIIELQATNVSLNLAAPLDKRAQPLGDRYIIVAPRPQGGLGTFEGMKQQDFMTLIEKSLAEVCFDSRSVFAAGNGSGGRVLMGWLVNFAEKAAASGVVVPQLRAAAVVGAYSGSYKPPTPVIFIHSTYLPDSRPFNDDDGLKALERFVTGNGCTDATTPVAVAGCNSDDAIMDPHCVDFDDCGAALRWCQPDDAASMASADPWPCFANAAIDQFFSKFLE